MRTNDPFVSFLVFVGVGGECGLPGRRDGGREPDSGTWLGRARKGAWLSQASAFPTGVSSQQVSWDWGVIRFTLTPRGYCTR